MKQRALIRALATAGAIAMSVQRDSRRSDDRGAPEDLRHRERRRQTGAVRKDKVIFSWLGHISGAVSFLGRVIMMDTYAARIEVRRAAHRTRFRILST